MIVAFWCIVFVSLQVKHSQRRFGSLGEEAVQQTYPLWICRVVCWVLVGLKVTQGCLWLIPDGLANSPWWPFPIGTNLTLPWHSAKFTNNIVQSFMLCSWLPDRLAKGPALGLGFQSVMMVLQLSRFGLTGGTLHWSLIEEVGLLLQYLQWYI